uniref:Uncharacterized protein n=1 Tax=Anguilla anguilla TaxID=7936 RepID=A0A0E9WUW8_ANGAN
MMRNAIVNLNTILYIQAEVCWISGHVCTYNQGDRCKSVSHTCVIADPLKREKEVKMKSLL